MEYLKVYGSLAVSLLAVYFLALYQDEVFGREWMAAVLIFAPALLTLLYQIAAVIAKSTNSRSMELDRELLDQLLTDLPEELVRQLDNQDFLATFRDELRDALFSFVNGWEKSLEKEFLAKALNCELKALKKMGETFAGHMAEYTVPRNPGFCSVVPMRMDPDLPEEWVRKQAKELNHDADRFCAQYRRVIRLSRRRLNP